MIATRLQVTILYSLKMFLDGTVYLSDTFFLKFREFWLAQLNSIGNEIL